MRWSPKALARRFLADTRGSAAAEFAMVLPVVVLLSLGVIGFMMMMSSMSALHFAAETGARCAAINKTTCGTAGATQTYALGKYKGPTISGLAFTQTNASCGKRVVGAGTIVFSTGLQSISVPVSAAACYPNQN
jgi:Flp pilus assembly pilin Flp